MEQKLPYPSQMLDSAKRHLTLLDTTIHEVKQFIQALQLSSRSTSGLPTFLRTLERENVTLCNLVTEISVSSTNLDDLQLTKREQKLDASATTTTQSVAQWNRLKKSHSFVAINQSFQGSSKDLRKREIQKRQVSGQEKHNLHRLLKEQARVEVDVVQEGREWIAAKAISRDRLARQLNDSGWGWGDHELGDEVDRDEWEDTPLAKYVQRLVNAARMNLEVKGELDIVLDQLEHIDPLVKVIIEDQDSDFVAASPPPLDEAIDNMVGNELASLTSTINLDHTILIDLISDLTHLRLEPQPWQSRTTRAQIDEENAHEGGLMSRVLYPVLAGRKLVCTREAADHFHDVLRTVGTETERERGRLLVPWGDDLKQISSDLTRQRFQQLTIYPLPPDVQIPVSVAQDVALSSGFKSSKLSIFMYGWAAGLTTVTSNKEVRGQIRTWVEAHRKSDEETGPQIFRLEVTRNLLAKAAKPREGWQEKDEADGNDDES
ncbi:hypothetical protein QL093DRAFT_2118963 [Fusarium oxysporum]|nr:hypothetical protein QL093DRAFT_2118963 [Fusarium oxysporum]